MGLLTALLVLVPILISCVDGTSTPRRPLRLGTATCALVRKYDFFSYNPRSGLAPSRWSRCYKDCNGPHQSPIDIRLNTVQCMGSAEEESPGYVWYRRHYGYARGRFLNNGHSSEFSTHNGDVRTYGKVLLNVPGRDESGYVFSSLHFHIGANGSRTGSEHRINGRGFRGEIHMVHWRKTAELNTYEKAYKARDGLVAVGVFFNVVRRCHTEADRLILKYVYQTRPYRAVKDPAFVNPSLLLPADGRFYTYKGSKTTPPCNTNIIWIVYNTPTTICYKSYRILMALRSAEIGLPYLYTFGNDRPIQNSGGYDVQANFLRCD